MGSANEAACAILSDIKGAVSVYHDTPTTRV
ncbi:NAD(P)/FAD-dependent oxidoreductase, partial [Campylobacter jejuni]|nr:NAD(P)/FAD-dependent oxidoreductase [Campylobacter jejuni]